MEIYEILKAGMARGDAFSDLYEQMRTMAKAGIPAHDVMTALECLRAEAVDEGEEDRILDLMDIATGYCSEPMRLWPID